MARFEFQPGELILADRGYSHWAGAARVLDCGAALLLRWHTKVFPLRSAKNEAFEPLEHLRRLTKHTAGEWQVQFRHGRKTYRLRLCAVRKNRLAAERARSKAIEKAHARGKTAEPLHLELAEYILVLTSLPVRFSASRVLELYRCRWQIELAFKRLKTLLGAGHVPKTDDQSARAWMQAKLLTALLMERLLLEAKIFSPWGYPLRAPEPVAAGD